MSIFKVVRRAYDGVGILQDRLDYIGSANASSRKYIYGVGVAPAYAYEQMMYVKNCYGQEDGKAFFHYVISPDSAVDVFDDGTLFDAGVKIANLISTFHGRYQVVMALHFDTNRHIHVIANNIDCMTGKRLHLEPVLLAELKGQVSNVLMEAGLSPVLQYSSYENNGH